MPAAARDCTPCTGYAASWPARSTSRSRTYPANTTPRQTVWQARQCESKLKRRPVHSEVAFSCAKQLPALPSPLLATMHGRPLPRGVPHRSTSNRASKVTFKDRLQLMYLGMTETWVPSCSVWFVKARRPLMTGQNCTNQVALDGDRV